MVKAVTYFVSEEFNERTYESCKNVQFPAQSDTVMGLLCGAYGSKKCTAKRSDSGGKKSILKFYSLLGGLTTWGASLMVTHPFKLAMSMGKLDISALPVTKTDILVLARPPKTTTHITIPQPQRVTCRRSQAWRLVGVPTVLKHALSIFPSLLTWILILRLSVV